MKYTLTISDMDGEQFVDVCNKLNMSTSISGQVEPVVLAKEETTYSTEPQPAPAPAPIPQINEDEPLPSIDEKIAGETTVDYIDPNAELDSDGLPWDERIHAGTKKQNKDGTWKRKRNVQDFQYDEVVKELKDAIGDNSEPVADNVSHSDTGSTPVTPPSPQSAAPALVPQPTTPPSPNEARDFGGLMQVIMRLQSEQKIDEAYIMSIVTRINEGFKAEIQTITDVAVNSEMVEFAFGCLEVDQKL